MNLGRAKVLTKFINDNNYKYIVELGLWDGRTANYILENCPSINEYYGVDEFRFGPNDDVTKWTQGNHTAHLMACHQLYLKHDNFKIIISDTVEACMLFGDPVDLVFIDADHSYEKVADDILYWKDAIVPGGMLTGHDIDWPGVKKAVEESFGDNYTVYEDNVWAVQY